MALFSKREPNNAVAKDLPLGLIMLVALAERTGRWSLLRLHPKIRREVRKVETCTDELPMWGEQPSLANLTRQTSVER